MKFKYISLAITSTFLFVILALMPAATFAQEGELQVVDEVIAQINDDVITLSMLKRETKERIEALSSALVGEPAIVRSLMVLLLETDRIALVPQIALAFGDLVDRREGIAKARITTAVPLEEPEQRELVSRLERESGRKLRASFAVDPTLIGGAKVQIGDHLIDSSVRAKLVALGRQLAS